MLITKATTTTHRFPSNLFLNDILDYEGEKTYKTFDSALLPLNNVWVSPDSVVYKRGILLKETLASKDLGSYYRGRHLIKKILAGKKVNLGNKTKYLLVTDSWSAGHFHWFCDVLPKLISLSEMAGDFSLLIPDTPYTRNIATESLKRLDLRFRDIIWMDESSFYSIKNLFYLTRITKSGQMHKKLMERLHHTFTQNFSGGKDRFYISRDKARYRKVTNEKELLPVLRAYNFEIVNTDLLSFSEQFKYFSSASVICGLHGAGLTNCVFMPTGGKMVELRKRENGPSNVGYWHLSDSMGHDYYYYNGTPDSDLSLVGRGCNLRIDLLDFEKKLLRTL